jgi:hypothetical protein
MSTLRLSNLAILVIEHDKHIDIDNCIKKICFGKNTSTFLINKKI